MLFSLAWVHPCWPRMLARILACRPEERLVLSPESSQDATFSALLHEQLACQGLDSSRVSYALPRPQSEECPLFLIPAAALGPEDIRQYFAVAAEAAAAALALGAPAPGMEIFSSFFMPLGPETGETLLPPAFENHFVEQALALLAKDESRLYRAEALRRAFDLPSLILPIMAEVPRAEGGLRRVRTRGLDLGGQLSGFYGKHRSGWNFALGILGPLHNPKAPYLESFVEKRFNWGDWLGDHQPPIEKPWLGFVHVPPEIPAWFSQSNSLLNIRETVRWKRSEPWCRGFFTLTHWLKDELEKLTDLPVRVLPHPAETVSACWSAEAYLSLETPLVMQAGITYRNLHAVHMLGQGPFSKLILCGSNRAVFDSIYAQEEPWLIDNGKYTPGADASTTFVDFISNEEYDRLFSENIVMCEYYTASASNTVVECMVRNTPLLINPLPPVVEYLGEAYPLYFTSYEEARAKVSDPAIILATHDYLKKMDKTFLSPEYFLTGLMESDLYQGL